jgi:hypothetical protein
MLLPYEVVPSEDAGSPSPTASAKSGKRRKPLSELITDLAALLSLLALVGAVVVIMARQPNSMPAKPAEPPDASREAQAPLDLSKYGVLASRKCASPAPNGKILEAHIAFLSEDGHQIEINNGSQGDAIVKVRDHRSGDRLLVAFFVEQYTGATLKGLPDGDYVIQYAFGDTLGADCTSFANISEAGQFPSVEHFATKITPKEIVTASLTLTLYSVPSGNVVAQAIDAATFNAE